MGDRRSRKRKGAIGIRDPGWRPAAVRGCREGAVKLLRGDVQSLVALVSTVYSESKSRALKVSERWPARGIERTKERVVPLPVRRSSMQSLLSSLNSGVSTEWETYL